MPEQAATDYTSIPPTSGDDYHKAQAVVVVRARAMNFTNEEIKDILRALGLAEK